MPPCCTLVTAQARFYQEHTSEFYGYYEVLRGEHVPIEVVTEENIQQGDLDGYQGPDRTRRGLPGGRDDRRDRAVS